MANTYKIKPLEWVTIKPPFWNSNINRFKASSPLDDCRFAVFYEDDTKKVVAYIGGRYNQGDRREFVTEDDAKAWIEERHIAKVREFLEVLE
jgi:hypothetical protein